MKVLYWTAVFLLSHNLWAAPIPATSSSDFLKTGIGLFRSPYGFKVSADKTTWIHTAAPNEQPFIATIYKAPQTEKGVQPLITVRLDSMKRRKTLNQYMREWVKVYPRLGFRVLATQKIKINDNTAFLIDLIHSKSHRQVRQVVFVKDSKAVVMSCRGHQDGFKKTVKSCNQIIRNFDWI